MGNEARHVIHPDITLALLANTIRALTDMKQCALEIYYATVVFYKLLCTVAEFNVFSF